MSEQATYEEFERVLRTEQFATIHDLAQAMGLRSLAAESKTPVITSADADNAGDATVHPLPNRR